MASSTISTISILGCGWYGLALAETLIERGYRVRGSTTTPRKLEVLRTRGIDAYLLDIGPELEPSGLAGFFESGALVLNIPPGRSAGVKERHPGQVAAVARAVSTSPCDFVVFISSTSIYPELNRSVTEADGESPDKTSGRALRAAEDLLMAHRGFDCTVLRMAGLIGPGRLPGNFLSGKSDVGRGDAPVNLVHRDDAVESTCVILEHQVRNEVFNIVADEHPLRRDYYTRAARAIGVPAPGFVTESECAWKIVSGEKFKQQLGYTYRHPDPASCGE